MKITILDKQPDEEDEIIIKCSNLDDNMMKLINSFKAGKAKLNFYKDSKIVLVSPDDIYYFETIDQRVFAYTENEVFESRSRLYMLEESLPQQDFFRASKAVIINLNKIESISTSFGGRFEAVMKNGYKIIISRMYVNLLKERLGI